MESSEPKESRFHHKFEIKDAETQTEELFLGSKDWKYLQLSSKQSVIFNSEIKEILSPLGVKGIYYDSYYNSYGGTAFFNDDLAKKFADILFTFINAEPNEFAKLKKFEMFLSACSNSFYKNGPNYQKCSLNESESFINNITNSILDFYNKIPNRPEIKGYK